MVHNAIVYCISVVLLLAKDAKIVELDINQILNTVIAGGAIYGGIRIEIKFLWRDIGRMFDKIRELEKRIDKA